MTKKSKQFYVYILRDPRPGKDMQPFYVGKGKGERARDHLRVADDHYNPFMGRMISKMRKVGLEPLIEIVQHVDVETDAFRLEIELIAKYGRRDLKAGPLCNLTDGGEGVAGRVVGPEEIERSRRVMRDCWANNPAFAAGNAERMRKYWTDPAWAKAHDERLRKLNADPEFAAANAERSRKAMLRLHADPEFARDTVERARKLHADPELVKSRDERLRKLNANPDFAKATSDRMRKHWTNPEFVERMRKLKASPEFQAKRLAGLRASAAKRAKLAAETAKTSPAGAGPANDNQIKALAA